MTWLFIYCKESKIYRKWFPELGRGGGGGGGIT